MAPVSHGRGYPASPSGSDAAAAPHKSLWASPFAPKWSGLASLELELTDRLAALVHDRLCELQALLALEPLHRCDHAHHQQGDEQDQADVFDRSLPATRR